MRLTAGWDARVAGARTPLVGQYTVSFGVAAEGMGYAEVALETRV